MHLGINVWYRTFFMQKMIPSILQGFSSECLSVSRLETQAVNGGNHYFLCCKQWRRRDVFTFRDKGSLLIDTKEILQCQEKKTVTVLLSVNKHLYTCLWVWSVAALFITVSVGVVIQGWRKDATFFHWKLYNYINISNYKLSVQLSCDASLYFLWISSSVSSKCILLPGVSWVGPHGFCFLFFIEIIILFSLSC